LHQSDLFIMAKSTLLLAIDIGSSGAKAGIFDALGCSIAVARQGYDTAGRLPGWQEQEPEVWWGACLKVIKEVCSKIEPAGLAAVCVTGMAPTMVCIDARGQSVRPAPLWSDCRATAEANEVIERTGRQAASFFLSQLLWLKRHEPDNYRRTRWVLQSFEYISFKLTGEVASIALSRESAPWNADEIALCSLNPEQFPPRVCQTGEVFGQLLPDRFSEIGLRTGLPVIAGTVDTFAAWIGTATVRVGQVCCSVGTTSSIALVCDRKHDGSKARIGTMRHVIGDAWVATGPMSSGGLMVDWFARQFYRDVADPFEQVMQEASAVPVGAEGLLALPYLTGERTPIFDSSARGVFFGIAPRHKREHFARAALESVAYAIRDVYDILIETGRATTEVRLAGPLAHHRTWSRMIADMLGQSVLVPVIAQSGLLGAAIIACWGAGKVTSAIDAAETMVRFCETVEPDLKHHARYSQSFGLFRFLYKNLKSSFADLDELTAGPGTRNANGQ
jgi:xylulokinase